MSEQATYAPWLHRGGVCVYHREPFTQLVIESEPFRYGGYMVVQCRTNAGSKASRRSGLYAVEALREWVPSETQAGTKKR